MGYSCMSTHFDERKNNLEVEALVDKYNFFLLNIPAGKPSHYVATSTSKEAVPTTTTTHEPKESSDLSLKSQPGRVKQNGNKGKLCFYYALKTHAMSLPNYLEERNQPSKRYIAEYRRAMSQHFAEHQIMVSFDIYLNKNKLQSHFGYGANQIRLEIISQFLKSNLDVDKFYFKNKKYNLNAAQILQIFNDFCDQPINDFFQYLDERYFKESIGTHLTLLRLLRLDPDQECEDFQKYRVECLSDQYANYIPHLLSNPKATVKQKEHILTSLIHQQIAKVYGLEPIAWKPTQKTDNIDVLFDCLKKAKKPIIVNGSFGSLQYEAGAFLPVKEKDLDTYEIYSWKSSKRKPPIPDEKHALALIGVEKDTAGKGGGYVYLIDPEDISEPGKRRKLCMLSFETFSKFACDDSGEKIIIRGVYKDQKVSYIQGISTEMTRFGLA